MHITTRNILQVDRKSKYITWGSSCFIIHVLHVTKFPHLLEEEVFGFYEALPGGRQVRHQLVPRHTEPDAYKSGHATSTVAVRGMYMYNHYCTFIIRLHIDDIEA